MLLFSLHQVLVSIHCNCILYCMYPAFACGSAYRHSSMASYEQMGWPHSWHNCCHLVGSCLKTNNKWVVPISVNWFPETEDKLAGLAYVTKPKSTHTYEIGHWYLSIVVGNTDFNNFLHEFWIQFVFNRNRLKPNSYFFIYCYIQSVNCMTYVTFRWH